MNTTHPDAKIAAITNSGVAQINELQSQLKTKEGKEIVLIAYER